MSKDLFIFKAILIFQNYDFEKLWAPFSDS